MNTYVSTRGGEERLNAAQAVIRGLSGNKGLFVPEVFPQLPVSIEEMQGMKYQDVAKIVIGTFFDDYTEEEIASIARFAKSLPGVRKIHLLPYHRLGQDKYEGLGRPYLMSSLEPPSRETMQKLLKAAEEASGLYCQIGG